MSLLVQWPDANEIPLIALREIFLNALNLNGRNVKILTVTPLRRLNHGTIGT